jgi:hypothetical protein
MSSLAQQMRSVVSMFVGTVVPFFFLGIGAGCNVRVIRSILIATHGDARTTAASRLRNSTSGAKNGRGGGLQGAPLDPDPRPKHLRLVMVGDSLTRYQYVSLAYFLNTATWFNSTSRSEPNIVVEKSFTGWAQYFEHTTHLLAPNERCDCHRPKFANGRNTDFAIENRYFFDAERDNMLVYLQGFGHKRATMHGRVPAETALHNISASRFVHNFTAHTWAYRDWDVCVRDYMAKLDPKPTHAIFNAGYWPHSFGRQPVRDRLVQALNDTGITGIWKTTSFERPDPGRTVWKGGSNDSDYLMAQLFHPNVLNIDWTSKVRAELYCDDVHYFEPVYRIKNEAMLEMVGHAFPSTYARQNISEVLV